MSVPASEPPQKVDVERHLGEIADRGFTVLERVIEPELLDAVSESIDRLEHELKARPATNEFEGVETLRLYNLLAHGDPFGRLPIHEAVLPVVEGVLDDGCLISTVSSINIGPGETPQLIHSDDQVIALPRPHPPVVCNTMWALTDFNEENGATRVVPGSHLRDRYPELGVKHESIPAEMPRGSVLVWHGSLWHGGGANSTGERRVGIAVNYCAGFIRQQETQQLGVPSKVAEQYPERLQRLLGYGVYHGLIGHIDKRDPISLLGERGDLKVVWDR
jgi:ectoine hydroxylase-related dioxygenase (phytanoyl-CoA dioxygenase family)